MFKTLVKIILIVITGVFFTSCADAKVLSKDFINKQVTSQLNQQMKSTIKGELKTEIIPLYLNDIVVSDGETKIKAYFKDRTFSPRKIATVDILVNNKIEKKINMPINLKVYDEVWVTTGIVTRDKNFNISNTELKRKDITNNYENVLRSKDDITEYVANKNFGISEIINKKYIKQKPDITKNSTISAIMQANTIQIAFEVQATENGCIGDMIKVKSPKYKRFYMGEVINKNMVLVRI